MANKRRNLIILGLVVALLGGSIAAIMLIPTRLGLDLAGGISLVYKVTPNDPSRPPTDREMQNAIKVINDRVNSLGVTEAEVQNAGKDRLVVSLPDVTNPEEAKNLVGSTAKLLFYKWENNVVKGPLRSKNITDQKAAVNLGYTELHEAVALAAKQKGSATKADKLNDGVPHGTFYLFDDKDKLISGPARTKEDLLAGNDLRVKDKKKPKPLNGIQPEGSEILYVPRGIQVVSFKVQTSKNPQYYVIRDNYSLTGDDVKSASQGTDQAGGPSVDLAFTGKGGDKFHRVTRELRQDGEQEPVLGNKEAASHRFAIVLDGKIVSLANISNTKPDLRDGIAGGRAQITNLSVKEAQDVAKKVDLGALPVDLRLEAQTQVSASLGKQALAEALLAALIGFGLVFFFLLGFYRVLGVIAGMALIIYGIYFFAVTKVVGFTFTLPGIAGLVLTLSVAADANIVIFERIKEEIRAGRSMKAAISTGYQKGFSAILDANVVTIMVAFILFVLATAGVRGFAAALGLGTIVSLFTAVMATSAILGLLTGWKGLERKSALGVSQTVKQRWHFDFMGNSNRFFSLSGVILVIGALGIAGIGLNLGIDFTGGTRVTVGLEKNATEAQVRSIFSNVDAGDAKIQRINGSAADELGKYAFQVSSDKIGPKDVPKIRADFDQRFGIRGPTEDDKRFEVVSVGPTFGAVVARSAVIAIIFSLLVIGAYVSFRFTPKFSVPVLIGLAHDILITVGVYALIGREVSSATVAALLTILGFSLYDAIIVFDRVRENMPRMPRAAFSQIVNRSMSEVFTRSLATSFVTLLPIIALLLFGGETLKDFAFALMVGTISGAYSSIFISAPVLTHWKEREPIFQQRRERIMSENNGVVPAFAVDTIGGEAVTAGGVPMKQGKKASGEKTAAQKSDAVSESGADQNGAASADAAGSVSSGAVARPGTKAERRAARQRRKHGRQ
ncbi:MAG: protein translocase subunit SecD [Actinobacteria bacterium]|nr:protein translocase subunit SecD [Actinomycetota bacterium]